MKLNNFKYYFEFKVNNMHSSELIIVSNRLEFILISLILKKAIIQ